MRLIIFIMCGLLVSSSLAHEGYGLEEGIGHNLSHFVLVVLVVVLAWALVTVIARFRAISQK
jgi:hypothetical protein